MIDDRTKMLASTVKRLLGRGTEANVKRILNKSHAADVAAMLEVFPTEKQIEIFNLEESFEKKAEVLSYLNNKSQVAILQLLTKGEVIQMISLLDSDDAADILGELPEDEAKEILSSMKREESEGMADLMAYPEDTAGGLMGTDYFGLNQNIMISEAIKYIQEEENESKVAFYIYVVNDNNQLVGVVSLKQLLLSRKSTLLRQIMHTDVVSVDIEVDQADVAKVVEKYDFLCVPVIDSDNTLCGVVTIDDILDVIRGEAEEEMMQMGRAGAGIDVSFWQHFKARLFWLVISYIGGLISFVLVDSFRTSIEQPVGSWPLPWIMLAVLPLLLSMGTTVGSQTATVLTGACRGVMNLRQIRSLLFREFNLAISFAVLFGGITYGLSLGMVEFPPFFVAAVVAHLFCSVALGSFLPLVFRNISEDLTLGSVPLFTVLVDILAIALFFASYLFWPTFI